MSKKSTNSSVAWWMVFLLCSLMVIAYLDRSVVSLMVEPIKRDLQITDEQIGLLLGAAFALFYFLAAIPAAIWADKGNRKRLILLGVAIWAVATFCSGIVTSFALLIVCRAMLAAGEATLGPAGNSLIADLFTGEKRIVPAMLFTFSTSIGNVVGLVVGGKLLENLTTSGVLDWPLVGIVSPWQGVFILVAIPAFVFLLIFLFTTKEPERKEENTKLKDRVGAIQYFKNNKRLWTGYIGGITFIAIGLFAMVAWSPEVLQRYYGLNAESAGAAIGLVALVGGGSSIILVPLLSQALRKAGRMDSIPIVSLVLALIGAVALFIGVQQTDVLYFEILLGIASFCLAGAMANLLIGIQIFVPTAIMGIVSAIVALCSSAVGNGIGPTITPYVASIWFNGEEGLHFAMTSIVITCSILGSILLFISRSEVYKEVTNALEN